MKRKSVHESAAKVSLTERPCSEANSPRKIKKIRERGGAGGGEGRGETRQFRIVHVAEIA